jgi:hypothetical protein
MSAGSCAARAACVALAVLPACARPDAAAPVPPAPDAPVGGSVVLSGADGVYVADAEGTELTRVADASPIVHATTEALLVGDAEALVAYALDGSALGAGRAVACGSAPNGTALVLGDAVVFAGTTFLTCVDPGAVGGLLARLGADGAVELLETGATSLVSDRGALYAVHAWGREGDTLAPVDPATGAPLAEPRWGGYALGVRGDLWWSVSGEPGNSDAGAILLRRVSDAAAEERRTLEDGAFPTTVDAIDGAVSLVGIYAWPDGTSSARLLDPSGGSVAALEACDHGALAWRGGSPPRVAAWCPRPLRRATYA